MQNPVIVHIFECVTSRSGGSPECHWLTPVMTSSMTYVLRHDVTGGVRPLVTAESHVNIAATFF